MPEVPQSNMHSWIFISGSGPETVEVRQGEDVTLACSNTSTEQSQTIWFRLVNRTKPNAIASMFTPTQKALICPGFDKTKFNMTSNISTIFVHIMRADLSDSGLYFCGIYGQKCIEFSAVTFLNVTQFQDGEDDKLNDLNESQNQCSDTSPKLNIILSGLCILLTIIIIALAFKVKNLKSAVRNVPQQEGNQDYFCGMYTHKCIEFSTVTFLNVTQFRDGEDDKLSRIRRMIPTKVRSSSHCEPFQFHSFTVSASAICLNIYYRIISVASTV
ncbi:uncharacterized protein LOC130522153 isoform X2 [Takifugu flavidus]|uniref:uncharacterized protein LOC130522153 isoform X2 n=1 Tax=Takifugu flavidus TaxID=433684 RepID=UPI002544A264|nr:uncharacterized protein LOC130522153 isoform X2 [Takifugu flavidus]